MDKMDKRIRIGIVGFGNMGRHYYEELLAGLVEQAEVTAVYTSSAAKRSEIYDCVTVVSSVDALFDRDDVDAILIATPNDTHAKLAKAALSKGKHVLVEKPAGLDRSCHGRKNL